MANVEVSDLRPGMASVPDDVDYTTETVTAWDGTDLFLHQWYPAGRDIGAVVCLQHGFGEHAARYHHFASFLARSGYAVHAVDARGHGRSGGARAYITRFEEYPRDFDFVASRAARLHPEVPLFGFGHSYGGLTAMHHALMAPGRIRAYALTSPFLGFEVDVPVAKRVAGDVMSKIYPRLAIPSGLEPTVLSHDAAIVEQYANDPLNLKIATARWFTETKQAQAELAARAEEIRAPFQILASAEDALADVRAAEAVFHRLKGDDREFDLLEGLYHEALNEQGWDAIAARIVAWYRAHTETPTG